VLTRQATVEKEFVVPVGLASWVKDGDLVTKGQRLTDGSLDIHELYLLKGREAVQKYILREIQYIYASQGQRLNDKHIEIIIRQMFSRLYVTESGDTELLPGEIVTVAQLEDANDAVSDSGDKATADRLLLGITKASLSTDSFLSAASFQETARVLIDAAVTGKVDYLRGLKENVIIGRLIPAGTGLGVQKEHLAGAMVVVEKKREATRIESLRLATLRAAAAAEAALAEQVLAASLEVEPVAVAEPEV